MLLHRRGLGLVPQCKLFSTIGRSPRLNVGRVTPSRLACNSSFSSFAPSPTTRARFFSSSSAIGSDDTKGEVYSPQVIGIDLGTTNSCVSVVGSDGKPVVIENPETGKRTTPSIVAFSNSGELLVGEPARRQSVINPKNTVYGTKRLVGRRYDDPAVSDIGGSVPYTVVKAKNGDAWVEAAGKTLSPSQVGAYVLGKLKEAAEAHVGQGVKKAVITVPAYFNDSQRQATKDAGTIAGLEVKRIINEPTAAALAYGMNNDEDQTIAVYDLGGGTFDVSVLELGGGNFTVVSTNGDTFLGGEDFDEAIMSNLFAWFKKEHGADLSSDRAAVQRVREAVESAKKELDHSDSAKIMLPFIQPGLNFDRTLTRAEFEDIIRPLVERTATPCHNALKDAGLTQSGVGSVLLVGGMTRTPLVQQKVREIFGLDPSKGVNPDEVVAQGAAIQGAIVAGEVSGLILVDVTPLSLGVDTTGDIFSRIINRNSNTPTEATKKYTTSHDGQKMIRFGIFQGEREIASGNHKLGECTLPVLPAPAGVVSVDVTFKIDVDGIVHVTARDPVMGKEIKVQVQASGGLDDREIQRMLKEAEQQKQHDERVKKVVEVRNAAESAIAQAQEYLEPDEDSPAQATEEEKDELRTKSSAIQGLLDSREPDPEELETLRKDLYDAYLRVGQRIYQGAAGDSPSSEQNQEEGTSDNGEDGQTPSSKQ